MSFMDYWKKFTNTEDDEDFEESVNEEAQDTFEARPFSNVPSCNCFCSTSGVVPSFLDAIPNNA